MPCPGFEGVAGQKVLVESFDHTGHADRAIGPTRFIAVININGSDALISADVAAVSRNANTHMFSACVCLV